MKIGVLGTGTVGTALASGFVKAGHEVTPVLTPDAERFVTAHTFEALARREAPRDLYPHLVEADLPCMTHE